MDTDALRDAPRLGNHQPVGPVGCPVPTVVPVHRGRRTIGVLVTAADGTRWQRTVDVEGLARLVVVAVAVVGVAAARRPSSRIDRLSMGPGGWVSFRGFPAPKAQRRRPWWAVLLRAHRVT